MARPFVVTLATTVLVPAALACASQHESTWPPAPALVLEHSADVQLPPSVQAQLTEEGAWDVIFTLPSDVSAERVALAGSFNGWSMDLNPLTKGSDGRWRASLELPQGVHAYKFVLDRERWMPDPSNDDRESDGLSGQNALLRLGALGRPDELSATIGDGAIVTAALEHDPRKALYLQGRDAGRAVLRYRTLANDVEGVELAVRGGAVSELARVCDSGPFSYWETEVEVGEGPLHYAFVLRDGAERRMDPRTHTLIPGALEPMRTPEWSRRAIWYQIMPDRFRNGNTGNDPRRVRPWTSEWTRASEWEGADGQTFWEWFVFQRMYGGDLAGLADQLDYLQTLGVDALYLNPVFQADSHHKYNATDFRHVDERLGGGGDYAAAAAREDLLDPATWTWTPSDEVFLDLVSDCHRRGMRVVIDGVFNHVGVAHPAFVDVREKGKASRFADWFEVTSWEPFRYAGWAGFGELPVFKKTADGLASAAVKEHIFAVTRRWMDPDGDGDPTDGIDGWRLDVPMEIAMPFWEEWRALVKSINPDAYLSGEVWDRADEWLDGKRFDAVMNYRFADAAVAWIGHQEDKISASEIDRRLAELRLAYPVAATYSLMNLVDSHDTDRLVSMMKNPDRAYDEENREQDAGEYDGSRPDPIHYRRARLVALLQMTYVGAPMVYYGDEAGMWGADDPTNRKPMLWKDLEPYDQPDENAVLGSHLAHYRRVIALRRAHPALATGTFRTWLTDDSQDVWVFVREDARETLVVALNASSNPARVELPAGAWRAVYGAGEEEEGAYVVPAIDGRVWVRSK